MDVGNLISSSSAISKSSLYIWKFLVLVLLKPSLKYFRHNFTNMWNEGNCTNVLTLFCDIALVWVWMKTDLFQSCGQCWFFQICWHIEHNSLTASSFRISNSLVGILSPPLALFIVMLPKDHLISHARMPGSMWITTPSWLSGSLRPLLYWYVESKQYDGEFRRKEYLLF